MSLKGHNGLVWLQEKLLRKTLKKNFEIDNVDEGISLIKTRLQSKRVLIVLDDIDHISQLESLAGQRNWFGSGSTIIITTRDVHLLSDLGTQEKYMVKTLSMDDSLQLLSWHAFGVPIPFEEYTGLSKTIASYIGGLPLALTVIGSHLRGRSVQEWIEDVEKLKRNPHDDIQKILKISYDALDDDTQNIFLDIACFFVGHGKKDIAMILEACGFYAETGIRSLIEKCLVTVHGGGEFGRLEMHDLVRDMGREVVRKESPRDPSKRSRLMDPNDVFDVLQGNKGTERIEGVFVNSNTLKNVVLSTKVFKRMVNLRILILDGVLLKGSFKYLSNKLRLFRLHNCNLSRIPSDFCFEKLAVLDLNGCNIEEFQPNIQHLRCLKILKFVNCKQLKKMSGFSGAESLQILLFEFCSNLVKLHSSIGSLQKLVELYFEECTKLKELPNSVCNLKSLEVLSLRGCKKLKELPIELGKLEQLRELDVFRTTILHIPFSLGCLRNLKTLYLWSHKELVPSKSRPHQLLDTLSSPHFLSRRSRNPNPDGFLPSFANLCSLEYLRVSYNYLHGVDLRTSIGSLTTLESLDLSGSCYLQSLPFDLSHLSNLRSLSLDDWQNLRALLDLPPSLEVLSTKNCVSLEKIANLSTLKKLEHLNIENCKSLVELPGLESLESLQNLAVANCSSLSIPLIENWYQACSGGGDTVKIWVQVCGYYVGSVSCRIPTLLRQHGSFDISYRELHGDDFNGVGVSVRNKTTGDWIVKEPQYINIKIIERERIEFEVPTRIGEVMEVYAHFHPLQNILCVFEIHRNTDGVVRFFPSTRGWIPAI